MSKQNSLPGIQSEPLTFTIVEQKKNDAPYFVFKVRLANGSKAKLWVLRKTGAEQAQEHQKRIKKLQKSMEKGNSDDGNLLAFGSDYYVTD